MPSLENLLNELPQQGLFDLHSLGVIAISGPDAQKFLQGQLTCNLLEINTTQSRLGAYCTIKGRTIALFHIVQIDERYHLLMDQSLVQTVAKTLRHYAAFSRVTIDLSHHFSRVFGVAGKTALNSLTPSLVASLHWPEKTGETLTQEGYTLFRMPGRYPRWMVLVHENSPWPSDTSLEDPAAWDAYNILTGLPHLTSTTSGHYTPHKLGLIPLNAVSFTKGCYLGQEIVARTQYLGNQKGGLFWALAPTNTSIAPQTAVVNSDHEPLGYILQSTTIPTSSTMLLAVLTQTPTTQKHFIDDKNSSDNLIFTHDFAQ